MDIDEPGQPSFDPAADEAQPGQDMHADPTSKPQAVPSRFNPQAPRAARLLRSAVAQGPAAPKSGANPSQRTHLPSTFLPRREQVYSRAVNYTHFDLHLLHCVGSSKSYYLQSAIHGADHHPHTVRQLQHACIRQNLTC